MPSSAYAPRITDLRSVVVIPLGFGKLFTDRRFNWCYTTEPQPGCHNRKVIAPRGKVLGGSGSINGLIYIRGQMQDFNLWRHY
jgi:choline dehydrogenase